MTVQAPLTSCPECGGVLTQIAGINRTLWVCAVCYFRTWLAPAPTVSAGL